MDLFFSETGQGVLKSRKSEKKSEKSGLKFLEKVQCRSKILIAIMIAIIAISSFDRGLGDQADRDQALIADLAIKLIAIKF